ncbi:hypothetical protein [Bifidobacterium callitrichidarum]|uniref:Uncharacterized protein n=1 Tax=Bifidobacterium callitrichidarum TaxID=2052941 RepID=A0A2U2NC25_9BIFI|nr:hypothetical protein [Bifidobacterium callitrichidarum]PWG66672.1 hypothetical protein DF196_01860 [Bifidobacterium callitrichidarum]
MTTTTPPTTTKRTKTPNQALLAIWDSYVDRWKTTTLINGSIGSAAPLLLAWYNTPSQALQLTLNGTITNLKTLEQETPKQRTLRKWESVLDRFQVSKAENLYAYTVYEQWEMIEIHDDGTTKAHRLDDMLGLESRYHADQIKGLETISREDARPGDYCLYRCGGAWSLDEIQRDGYFPDFEWLDRWGQLAKFYRRGMEYPVSFRR